MGASNEIEVATITIDKTTISGTKRTIYKRSWTDKHISLSALKRVD